MVGQLNILHIFKQEPDGIYNVSILRGTPLGCAFKIGLQSCYDGSILETKEDVQKAYRHWFQYMLDTQVPHFIEELDDIAFKLLDGHDVNLIHFNEHHGEIIKEIIDGKINELQSSKSD